MNFIIKIKNALRGATQRWGSARMKRQLWNREFANGRWDFLDNTSGDVIYGYVEKYCRNGSVLDLGCGSGNTGCELDSKKYGDYTGVDISTVAVAKATQRSAAAQRDKINRYFQSDIAAYHPSQQFDVILFRESIYYIPKVKIKSVLDHYAGFLKPDGVFIIRWHDREQGEMILELLGTDYELTEQPAPSPTGPLVVVFHPRRRKTAPIR